MQEARKDNHTCFICHNLFDDKDLVYYAAPNASVYHYYCLPCYEEKIARQKFNAEISKIFRIVSPGPKLFSQRKRLLKKGFTDNVILETVRYLYEVKGLDKRYETFGLVNEDTAHEAHEYYAREAAKQKQKEQDLQNLKINKIEVKHKENVEDDEPILVNPDVLLKDDDIEWS